MMKQVLLDMKVPTAAVDCPREALEHYLKSSMEQGYARTLQMRRYADLLAEQLKRHNDYRTVCSLAKTQMDLGSFDAASRTIEAALSASNQVPA